MKHKKPTNITGRKKARSKTVTLDINLYKHTSTTSSTATIRQVTKSSIPQTKPMITVTPSLPSGSVSSKLKATTPAIKQRGISILRNRPIKSHSERLNFLTEEKLKKIEQHLFGKPWKLERDQFKNRNQLDDHINVKYNGSKIEPTDYKIYRDKMVTQSLSFITYKAMLENFQLANPGIRPAITTHSEAAQKIWLSACHSLGLTESHITISIAESISD